MKRILPLIFVLVAIWLLPRVVTAQTPAGSWWSVQSVDTMKYSRDLAKSKVNDPAFDPVIDSQVKQIAGIGATHVAIATPYDEEFRLFLLRWIKTARKYGLKVWLRGNWSGWEGWFGYPHITREEHIAKTVDFINKNKDLFVDGDIFTPCPECENGGPGDPRKTGDVYGFRQFLTDEYRATLDAFNRFHKIVPTNYASMNLDVAKLVMDKDTTRNMGGLVVIDHYVATPEILVSDIKKIAADSGGQVVLGEFGAPIPDINGNLDEEQQAQWIDSALSQLTRTPEVSGLNYWVGVGGSTQLWDASGKAFRAAGIVRSYYSPRTFMLNIKNAIDQNLVGTQVYYHGKIFTADHNGRASIPVSPEDKLINISLKDYNNHGLLIPENQDSTAIILTKTHEGIIFKLLMLTSQLLKLIIP